MLTQLDATLTGDEPLFEAYASIDAVLHARVVEWDADDATKEAKQQEEWREIGTTVVVVIALVFVCVKAREIFQWLLKIFLSAVMG